MSQATKGHFHLKQAFFTGFVALFPLALTVIVVRVIWQFILEPVSKPISIWIITIAQQLAHLRFPDPDRLPLWADWGGKIAALLIAAVAIYLLGLILRTVIGRQSLRWGDRVMIRIPLIRAIYPHAKQVSNFLFGERKMKFNHVVAIEYPRKGVYSIGFATSHGPRSVARHTGHDMVAVFVPTSPTPITGWTVMVRAEEVIDLDMTMDEAVRFTVSCGVLVPGEQAPEGLLTPETRPPLPPAQGGDAPKTP